MRIFELRPFFEKIALRPQFEVDLHRVDVAAVLAMAAAAVVPIGCHWNRTCRIVVVVIM